MDPRTNQVEFRGYRLDLGEIDAVLRGFPQAVDAAVAPTWDASGDVQLVGYLVVDGQAPGPTVPELRAHTSKALPDQMIPAAFRRVDRIPLDDDGQPDRQALLNAAADDLDQATYVPPVGELESQIAKAWEEVLGAERIGLDDDFFDLGGHSLLVLRVQFALHAMGWELVDLDIFGYPTVRALAAHLRGGASAG